MGVLVFGFGYAIFYGVVHCSIVWLSSCGSYYGSFVGWVLWHRLLWFGILQVGLSYGFFGELRVEA